MTKARYNAIQLMIYEFVTKKSVPNAAENEKGVTLAQHLAINGVSECELNDYNQMMVKGEN